MKSSWKNIHFNYIFFKLQCYIFNSYSGIEGAFSNSILNDAQPWWMQHSVKCQWNMVSPWPQLMLRVHSYGSIVQINTLLQNSRTRWQLDSFKIWTQDLSQPVNRNPVSQQQLIWSKIQQNCSIVKNYNLI